MPCVIDHVFLCTSVGAPEAERLKEFGLTEGAPNRHPGQGTACRRFFFRNAMLELLWVADTDEAQSELSRRTRLLERWPESTLGASPFGIILRPEAGSPPECPFSSWEYRPATMPDLRLQIASGTELDEPMWCYLERGRSSAEITHPAGFREVSGVHLVSPPLSEASVTQAMANRKAITLATGSQHLLELHFDGAGTGWEVDFRPQLPLVFRW